MPRMVGIDQTARTRHDLQSLFESVLLQVGFECFEVKAHRRADQRIDDGGDSALIFTDARADFRRDRHENIGRHFAHEFAQALLVVRIGGRP